MTARENIYLNGAILGMSRKEVRDKFESIVDFAGCRMYVDTPIKRFSSGMRVRLGFAVAAFLEPEILIVDEVLAVGDAEFQDRAIGKIQDIASAGNRTVVFVSHNMASVGRLCTRAVVIDRGRIGFDGDTKTAIARYYQMQTEAAQKRVGLPTESGVQLKSISVASPDAFAPSVFPVGASLDFQLTVELPKTLAASFEVRLGIDADDGTRIATMSTHHSTVSEELRRNGDRLVTLKCRVADVNLVPGKYFLFVNMIAEKSILAARRVLEFQMAPSDFHAIGSRYFNGVVTWRQQWAVQEAEAEAEPIQVSPTAEPIEAVPAAEQIIPRRRGVE